MISVEPNTQKMSDEAFDHALDAARNGYNGEYIIFSSPDQLFAALPPKRWVLIEKLQQLGPSSLRGLARAVGRDVKRVHEDVAALIEQGIFERNEENRLFVPFSRVRIEFNLFPSEAA